MRLRYIRQMHFNGLSMHTGYDGWTVMQINPLTKNYTGLLDRSVIPMAV